VAAQAIADLVHAAVGVGAGAVELVDEHQARHAVLVGLAPHRLGLRLHAAHGVEHGHGAVEHAQRALHLDGEVHVAGRVDDVHAVLAPEAGGGGGGDRDARSCSCSIQSMIAVPSCTSPIDRETPV
jgi:hypothetical protein